MTRRSIALAVLLMVSAALGARMYWAPAPTSEPTAGREASFEIAQSHLAWGNLDEAVLNLKVVLQQDAENAAARLLLGRVYVQLRQGSSAEKELKVASRLGVAQDQILPELGRAYLLQGKYQNALAEIHGGDGAPELDVQLLVIRGYAYFGLRRFDEAAEAFSEANRLHPEDARPDIGLALGFMVQGKLAKAEEHADAALLLAPGSSNALFVKGEVRRLNRDLKGALTYFDKAIEINPDQLSVLQSRAATLIDLNDNDKALADIEAIRNLVPNHPIADLFTSLIMLSQREYQAAESTLQKAERFLENDPVAGFVLGAVNYAQDEFEQARRNLTRFLHAVPDHLPARKLLAATLIRQGDPAEAIRVLRGVPEPAGGDPQILVLLGTAYLKNGQLSEAASYFERAVATTPDDLGMRTALAFSHLAAGSSERAVAELESIVNLDPGMQFVSVSLVLAHLSAGNFDRALDAIRHLKEQLPDSPLAANLAGVAYLGSGDTKTARINFEAAIAIDANYAPARTNLAGLDVREENTETASPPGPKQEARAAANIVEYLFRSYWNLQNSRFGSTDLEAIFRKIKGSDEIDLGFDSIKPFLAETMVNSHLAIPTPSCGKFAPEQPVNHERQRHARRTTTQPKDSGLEPDVKCQEITLLFIPTFNGGPLSFSPARFSGFVGETAAAQHAASGARPRGDSPAASLKRPRPNGPPTTAKQKSIQVVTIRGFFYDLITEPYMQMVIVFLTFILIFGRRYV